MNVLQDLEELTIRPATPGDAAGMSALTLSLTDFVVEASEKENAANFLSTLGVNATRERLVSHEFQFFVCECEGGIRGVIGMRDQTHLYHLFVDASFHGRGIARKLWDYVRDRSDTSIITVNSSPFAVPVYQKLGFVQVGEIEYQDGIEFIPMEYACR